MGGYFSIKRNEVSIDGNTFIRQDQVVAYCKALLEVFRCALSRTNSSKNIDYSKCSLVTDSRGPLKLPSVGHAAAKSLVIPVGQGWHR